jgi:hypothetical protein
MKNDFIQGDEWDTSITLDTFNTKTERGITYGTRVLQQFTFGLHTRIIR